MSADTTDEKFLSTAIKLAQRGRGAVEPNPMVGCLIVREGTIVGEGYHQKFGGPHAEVEAIRAAGAATEGADAFVTLEPCCHTGKTGPCTQALVDAGIKRVVIGCEDPNPQVRGKGAQRLRDAGIVVETGVLEAQARRLIAPFAKLMTTARPWVIAKWAMTLDGKIASHTGSSQWITGEASRATVHLLRGVVDAIVVGRGTVEADDPLLTARPAGPRTPARVVLDSQASLASGSKLIQSIDKAPLLVAASYDAPTGNIQRLAKLDVEVIQLEGQDHAERLSALLDELGRRQMANVLVEGGGGVLGSLLDLDDVDEVHAYLAPKLIGGASSSSPVAGIGIEKMSEALQLKDIEITQLGEDIRICGYVH